MTATSPESPEAQAHCPAHPAQAVLGACTRCGTFFCELDRTTVQGEDYCASCAERPEVDYLETFRLSLWGKRDTWAWLVGVGALFNLLLALGLLGQSNPSGMLLLVAAGVGVSFWLGKPFARVALCFVPVASAITSVALAGPQALVSSIWPCVVVVLIYRDPRNRLFFKQPLSTEELEKLWHLYANNRLARAGFFLGLFSLLIVPLAPVALVCSLVGLRRVDPTARPPIGRKGQALTGIILSTASLLFWLGFYAWSSNPRY